VVDLSHRRLFRCGDRPAKTPVTTARTLFGGRLPHAQVADVQRQAQQAPPMGPEKPNSNAREINSLPNTTRAVAGSTYLHFWHRKQIDPYREVPTVFKA
jgi:hypothetical protein